MWGFSAGRMWPAGHVVGTAEIDDTTAHRCTAYCHGQSDKHEKLTIELHVYFYTRDSLVFYFLYEFALDLCATPPPSCRSGPMSCAAAHSRPRLSPARCY